MGRGLGKLQREILDSLEESKESLPYYQGAVSHAAEPFPFCLPGWVIHRSASVQIAAGTYDLMSVSRFLANKRGLRFVEGAFQTAFSRAVAGLIRRGELVQPSLVPIQAVEKDPHGRVLDIADGMFIFPGRRTRFVQRVTTRCVGGRAD